MIDTYDTESDFALQWALGCLWIVFFSKQCTLPISPHWLNRDRGSGTLRGESRSREAWSPLDLRLENRLL